MPAGAEARLFFHRAALIVAAGAAMTLVLGWTNLGAAASRTPGASITRAAPAIGDTCLIGGWKEQNETAPGNWTWNNEVVAVSGLAGLAITFTAEGVQTNDFAATQPLFADYHGHQIKIVLRGSVVYHIHADGRQIVQADSSGNLKATFYYDGALQPEGTVTFNPGTTSYACTVRKTLHIEADATHAGYGPQVDDLTRADAAAPRPPPGSVAGSVISSVGSGLATPATLARAPLTLLVNVLITLGLILLVTFPSHLFNRTYEENHTAIRAWWERRLPWLQRLQRRAIRSRGPLRPEASFALVALSGGVLASLLDPRFGPNLRTLALFAGAALALTAGSALSGAAAGLYRIARHKPGPWRLHALPSGLLVAAICVLVSRLTNFQPGYLYGLIGGVAFARTLGREEEGHAVAITSLVTLVVSVAAWLLWVPVSAASSADPTGFGWALLSNFLAALFVSGTVGLLIGLVPLRFLPGETLANWHRGVWGAVFGLAGLTMLEVMLRPQSAGAHVASVPFWTTAGLFLAFGAASLLFWGYFRIQRSAAYSERLEGRREAERQATPSKSRAPRLENKGSSKPTPERWNEQAWPPIRFGVPVGWTDLPQRRFGWLPPERRIPRTAAVLRQSRILAAVEHAGTGRFGWQVQLRVNDNHGVARHALEDRPLWAGERRAIGHLTGEPEQLHICGRPAVVFTYNCRVEGVEFIFHEAWLAHPDLGYHFVASGPAEDESALRKAWYAILKNADAKHSAGSPMRSG